MDDMKKPLGLGQLHKIDVAAHTGQSVSVACPVCGFENPYRVLRTGNAIIACRECKSPLLLRIQGGTAIADATRPQAPQSPLPQPAPLPATQAAQLLGVARNAGDGTLAVAEHARVGEPVRIKCGNCGKMHLLKPGTAGKKAISCVACHTTITFTVDDPSAQAQVKVETAKEPAQPQATIALRDRGNQQAMGAITFGGFMGIKRKTIRLSVGQNTIGRADDEKPSSISFNDSFMSRQSVMIDVLPADDVKAGYRFLFRVLSAANPVYVNKQQYAVGDSVYLNYGDTLKLGRTTMRFVRIK